MTNDKDLTKGRKKSTYAKKIQHKLGRGRVDPRWMWWTDRAGEQTPPTARVTAQDIARMREDGERANAIHTEFR